MECSGSKGWDGQVQYSSTKQKATKQRREAQDYNTMQQERQQMQQTKDNQMRREVMDGLTYYVLPIGLQLLKANQQCEVITFEPRRPSFFGLYPSTATAAATAATVDGLTSEYIRSYEAEYGCIYEYVLTREIRVLALDDSHVLQTMYDTCRRRPEVQRAIETNYGLHTGLRDSDASQDRLVANYLNELGYEGYAASERPTVSGGVFHAEIVLNNAYYGVDLVRRVTQPDRIEDLKQAAKLKQLGEISRDKRRQQQMERADRERERQGEGEGMIRQCLFGGDDSDPDESSDDESFPALARFHNDRNEWGSDNE